MANRSEQVSVPDIGGATDVEVIEIFVKPGDTIAKDDSLITLESDKASMEVPSPFAGTVKDIQVKVGDKVSEKDPILTVQVEQEQESDKESDKKPSTKSEEKSDEKSDKPAAEKSKATEEKTKTTPEESSATHEVCIPDIGGATDVTVIEIAVAVGDKIEAEDSLITLEGDKASMEVPSPFAGEVTDIKLKEGDKVSEGDVILIIKTTEAVETEKKAPKKTESVAAKSTSSEKKSPKKEAERKVDTTGFGTAVHAGPAVRRIAQEFGIDLTQIQATGPKGRILKEDMQKFVKTQLSVASGQVGGGIPISAAPKIDFAKFGDIEKKPLNKIKKSTAVNLSRNWVTIPHVTQFDEADITEMEAFRQSEKEKAAKKNIRLTPLVFIMKAVVGALKEFPQFNASLDSSGQELIIKKYFHIGVAVDTPNGLVVPVIRDVDKKGIFELAKELGEMSEKARGKGLGMADMQGGCFSISSLGGIGGTAFTPIINAPEVAILGVSRSRWRPICNANGVCKTRLMLPLSLSYDHRVIDGADGARFIVYLAEHLADIRTLLL